MNERTRVRVTLLYIQDEIMPIWFSLVTRCALGSGDDCARELGWILGIDSSSSLVSSHELRSLHFLQSCICPM